MFKLIVNKKIHATSSTLHDFEILTYVHSCSYVLNFIITKTDDVMDIFSILHVHVREHVGLLNLSIDEMTREENVCWTQVIFVCNIQAIKKCQLHLVFVYTLQLLTAVYNRKCKYKIINTNKKYSSTYTVMNIALL